MKNTLKLLLPLGLWLIAVCFLFGKPACADAAKELQIGTNEIRLDGTIRELKTTAPHIVLDAMSFTLPSGKSQKFAAPKSKPVLVNAQGWIHAQNETEVRLKLADLKVGEVVIVIGRDGGTGQPLQAREIVVQRSKSVKAPLRAKKNPDSSEKLPMEPQLVPQVGNSGVVMRTAVSPTGEFFATGDNRGGVKIWKLDTGELHADLAAHYGPIDNIRSMAFSPDGRYLATGAEIGPAKLWHVASGKLERNLPVGGAIYGLDFAPTKSPLYSDKELPLVIASYTEDTKIVNALTGDVMQNIRSNNPEAFSGETLFSPDGTYLAREVTTGHIEMWDTVTEKVTTSIPHQMGNIMTMAFSPDGKLLAGTSFDRNMKLWDVASGRELVRFPQQTQFVNLRSVCFSPDGSELWSPYHEGVYRWDLRAALAGTPVPTPFDTKIHNVALITSAYIVSTQHEGVHIRSTGDLQLVSQTVGYAAGVAKMELSPDGRLIATGGFSNVLHVWDAATGVLTWTGNDHSSDLAFSPDGQSLATINFFPSDGKTLVAWTLPDGKSHNNFPLAGSHVTFGAGGLIAVGDDKGQVKLFDSEKHEVLKGLPDVQKKYMNIRQLTFSSDGSLLARCYVYDNEIEIWNAHKGERLQTLKSESQITSFAFSPDGKTVVAALEQMDMNFWNVASGEMISQFKTDSPIGALAFSRDGSLLAGVALNENKIQIWSTQTGETVSTLQGEFTTVDLAFTADGKSLLTASAYGHIRLWDIANRRWKVTMRALALSGNRDAPEWIAYTPEGYYTGSENLDAKVRWRVGRNLLSASTQKATLLQPAKVQAALSSSVAPEKVVETKATDMKNKTP